MILSPDMIQQIYDIDVKEVFRFRGTIFIIPTPHILCAFVRDRNIVGYDLLDRSDDSTTRDIHGVIYKRSIWNAIFYTPESILFAYQETPCAPDYHLGYQPAITNSYLRTI